MNYSIENQNPTRELYEIVENSLHGATHIASFTFSEFVTLNQIVTVLSKDNTVMALAGIKHITKELSEIGPIIVKEEYRSLGLGKILTTEAIIATHKQNRDVLLLTQNPKMVSIVENLPFKISKKSPLLLGPTTILALMSKFMSLQKIRALFLKPALLFRKQYVYVIKK
jgi:hypothetical protein